MTLNRGLSNRGEMTGYPKGPSTRIRIFLKAEIFFSVLPFRSYVIHAKNVGSITGRWSRKWARTRTRETAEIEPTKNPDFQKRSPEWRFLKTLAYRLRVDGRKRWTNSILGLTPRCEPGPHWLETSALTNAPVPFAPLASLATTRFPKKLGQTVCQNSATVLFDKTPTQFQTQARNGQCNA